MRATVPNDEMTVAWHVSENGALSLSARDGDQSESYELYVERRLINTRYRQSIAEEAGEDVIWSPTQAEAFMRIMTAEGLVETSTDH
jgi:hypothetical protein